MNKINIMNKILFCIALIFCFIAIFSIVFAAVACREQEQSNIEIKAHGYISIESFVYEQPKLKDLVKKCMEDNKITITEYKEIRDQYLKLFEQEELNIRKQLLIKAIEKK